MSAHDGTTKTYTVTVTRKAPELQSVALVSDPDASGADDDTYQIGDTIAAAAVFDVAVTVSGTPELELDVGGAARTAAYASGSGSTALTFAYDRGGGRCGAGGGGDWRQPAEHRGRRDRGRRQPPPCWRRGTACGGRPQGGRDAAGAEVRERLGRRPDLNLDYDEALSTMTAGASAFTVTVDGAARGVGEVTVAGSRVRLALAGAVTREQTVTLGYTDPTAGADDAAAVQDAAGNDAASFQNQAVLTLLPPQAPGLWWRRGTQDERDITLHWSPPADDGNSPILRYEYRVAGPAALSAWKEVPGGADARSVAPGRLEYGRSHFYSVRAVNAVGAGESYTRWVVMYPGEPRAPQNLTAEAFSPWDVRLSWERPAHGPDIEIIAYRVDVSWDGLDWISSFMLDADDEEWPRCADPSPDIRLWCEWFRLDDPTPTTWDRIGRESVRYFRVAAVYHYVPVGRYSQKQGPVSAPVRASTEGWAAAHPLVSVTLVSSSHRNYGKVKDGDTVVLADPAAGEYSLRVWPDVGVTVGSVYLELDGPVQYARTENERPYSLHGDWGTPARLAYGKPLPAGDYTFRATAYPEPDRGGEPIQTLTVSFTVVQEQQGSPATRAGALTAAFEGVPERHAGAAQELVLGVVFSEEVTIDEAGLREHALAVSGATVTGAARVAGEPGAWAVTIAPESVAAVQVRLVGERPCEEAGAICTVDGRRLSTELLTRIAGPVLTEVVLVDAAAGEDLGPVADGAVVVVADPDGGSYGLRVETALDAVVASVRLELTGPGAEDEVSVIANEEPYTLYGATDGVEHGEALPEGDYTLRATAHADADAEGEPLGRLAVSFTVSAPVLAQVVLVDAAAGEDLGPVADGAVVVVADPDGGSYGLRVETALGAVLASVRLELTGPGAEDEVSVIANEEPYTLYGATDGVEHGEALPEGDYTLRATAYADADAEGEPLQELTVSFTVWASSGLAVADARATEGVDAAAVFVVTLAQAAVAPVTVGYATADGSARAGADYEAVSGTLSFAVGEAQRSIAVRVLDDAVDEGEETFTLSLSEAVGAHVSDGEATGTIVNEGPLPRAWLARFGRTAGGQVLEAVSERLSGGGGGSQATIAGRSLSAAADAAAAEEAAAAGYEPVWGAQSAGRTGTLGFRELLAGSSFALVAGAGAGEAGGGARWTLWGRGAWGHFAGEEGELSLQGDVLTATLGADYEHERLLAGLALAYSSGAGTFTAATPPRASPPASPPASCARGC